MRSLLCLFVLCSFGFMACQQELDGGGGTPPPDGLSYLSRTIAISPDDTTTTTYRYDAQNRLIARGVSLRPVAAGGTALTTYSRFEYDGQGRVSRIADLLPPGLLPPGLLPPGLSLPDTLYRTVKYTGAAIHPDSTVQSISFVGLEVQRSVERYTYNGNGLTSAALAISIRIPASPPTDINTRFEFDVDANGYVLTTRIFAPLTPGSAPGLVSTTAANFGSVVHNTAPFSASPGQRYLLTGAPGKGDRVVDRLTTSTPTVSVPVVVLQENTVTAGRLLKTVGTASPAGAPVRVSTTTYEYR